MANTDRGRKPIKREAGQRMVDGKNFRLTDEVRHPGRAAEHDGRILLLVRLSRSPPKRRCCCLTLLINPPRQAITAALWRSGSRISCQGSKSSARNVNRACPRRRPRTIPHRRNDTTFTIDWKGRYRVSFAFVYYDRETDGSPPSTGIQRTTNSDGMMLRISNILASTLGWSASARRFGWSRRHVESGRSADAGRQSRDVLGGKDGVGDCFYVAMAVATGSIAFFADRLAPLVRIGGLEFSRNPFPWQSRIRSRE